MPRLLDERPLPAHTAWMSPAHRPSHEGVYERVFPGGPFSCWSGRAWNADAPSVDEAAEADGTSRYQSLAWRGLVEPPAQPCATCKGHSVIDRGIDEESGLDLIDECPDC